MGFELANPVVFRWYAICAALLLLKVLLVVPLIGRQRKRKGVVISPEDCVLLKGSKVSTADPDVERMRRAHRNDLENIPLFLIAASLYILTKPNPALAIALFTLYTVARYVHTYVYAVEVVKQPARVLSFAVGYLITGYIAVDVICHVK